MGYLHLVAVYRDVIAFREIIHSGVTAEVSWKCHPSALKIALLLDLLPPSCSDLHSFLFCPAQAAGPKPCLHLVVMFWQFLPFLTRFPSFSVLSCAGSRHQAMPEAVTPQLCAGLSKQHFSKWGLSRRGFSKWDLSTGADEH